MPLQAITAGQHPVTSHEMILSRSDSDTYYSLSHKKALDPNQKKTNNHQVISLSQKQQRKNIQTNFLSKDNGFFLYFFIFPVVLIQALISEIKVRIFSQNSWSPTGRPWLCFAVKTVCTWAVNISTFSKKTPKEPQQTSQKGLKEWSMIIW